MALKLNSKAFHSALGKAHAGDVDHGEWLAPEGADRTEDNSIGHEEGDEGKASEHKYPIMKGGKVSARGVGAALAYAEKNNESAIVGPLKKISAAIHGTQDLSRATEILGQIADKLSALPDVDVSSLDLSRAPRLAKCPNGDCGSHDITRMEAASENEGPMDSCQRCGATFAHKPGTITAEQYVGQQGAPVTPIVEHPDGEQEHDVAEDNGAWETPVYDEAIDPMATPEGLPNLESMHARGLFGVK